MRMMGCSMGLRRDGCWRDVSKPVGEVYLPFPFLSIHFGPVWEAVHEGLEDDTT